MNTNTTNSQTRQISTETAKIIESLNFLLQAESSAMEYFHETYGDQTDLWEKSQVKSDIEDLKTSLKLLLGDSVELQLGYLEENLI